MKIVTCVAFLLCGGAAFADDHNIYIGGSVGYTSVEDDAGAATFDDNPVSWKVLGGYQFTENLAVEGTYANLGEAEDNVPGLGDVAAEFSGFTATALGIVPVGVVDLFGKLGLYSGDIEVSALGVSADDSDSGLTIGAGAKFDLIENFSLRSDIDWYDADLDSLWSVNVGLTYSF